jgi:hypothetical protein
MLLSGINSERRDSLAALLGEIATSEHVNALRTIANKQWPILSAVRLTLTHCVWHWQTDSGSRNSRNIQLPNANWHTNYQTVFAATHQSENVHELGKLANVIGALAGSLAARKEMPRPAISGAGGAFSSRGSKVAHRRRRGKHLLADKPLARISMMRFIVAS